jgi:SAM-dependent methyltransferase
MEGELRNLLYRRPELYESAYDGSGDAVPKMCERLFERHLDRPPASLLDIGCGTGRDLAYLAERCPDCVGIDLQESMIAFARERRSHIDFRVGDMRSVRLGRTFDAITCMGIAIANLHADDDLTKAIATFAAHCEVGTVLVLEALNALTAEDGGTLARRFVVDAPGFNASADATYEHDRRRQLLTRRRVWTGPDGDDVADFVRFRTLAPRELEHHLASHGFETLGMYDNSDLNENELDGISLVVVARFTAAS